MEKKFTKREMFEMLLEVEEVKSNDDFVAFIEHEMELIAKKANRSYKPTAKQLENAEMKKAIVKTLIECHKAVTIDELQMMCLAVKGLTNQRISALLTALVKSGELKRTPPQKGCKVTFEIA